MGFLDSFFGRAKVEAENVLPDGGQSVTVSPQRAPINKAALRAASLRPGMWVVGMGQTGIVTACGTDGIVEITLANGDGTTKMAIDESGQKLIPAKVCLPPSEARQAYIEEIPVPRRGDLNALRAMGYINQSEAV
jgi:hypothetical protein